MFTKILNTFLIFMAIVSIIGGVKAIQDTKEALNAHVKLASQ